ISPEGDAAIYEGLSFRVNDSPYYVGNISINGKVNNPGNTFTQSYRNRMRPPGLGPDNKCSELVRDRDDLYKEILTRFQEWKVADIIVPDFISSTCHSPGVGRHGINQTLQADV